MCPTLKIVVHRTFCGRRITADGVHLVDVSEKARRASRQHLVGVTLVADVEDELVLRRVKHIMERHSRLHKTEVRADVSAVFAHAV